MAMIYGKSRNDFSVDGEAFEVRSVARSSGLTTEVSRDGAVVGSDATPDSGTEMFRNHHISVTLADGRQLHVEAGYAGMWAIGMRAKVDGEVIKESHPGRELKFPDSIRRFADQSDFDSTRQKASYVPIAVDIAMGIIFFFVARATDLGTAAIVAAALGLALIGAQRFVKVDLIGGLVLFGVVMLMISAGFAVLFDSGLLVQLRTTIIGLISATFFLFDGWRGGPWLGNGLSRYIPYRNINTGTLALGMGVIGAVMAVLNLIVLWLASEDVWLVYTTFLDIPLVVVSFWFVMHRARNPQAANP